MVDVFTVRYRDNCSSVTSNMNKDVKLLYTINNVIAKNSRSAIILAAGYGLRMVPLCRDIPKALLEIKGEVLIERIIRQLFEAGISDINIVVGFMKEQFEYLIDKYDVNLIVNREYREKNNLYSLSLVADKLENAYVIPCDVWCKNNPFSSTETESWYMVTNKLTNNSNLKIDRENVLHKIAEFEEGNREIGIAYLNSKTAELVRNNITSLVEFDSFDHAFWERAAFDGNELLMKAKVVLDETVNEINTYDDLICCDIESKSLESEYINIICKTLHVEKHEIYNIKTLKSGMTNKSFLFNCAGHKFIFRIPGEGTDKLINRCEEYDVYQQIMDKGISDEVIYMNPENGYKITRFIEGSRNCDAYNESDVKVCMSFLKTFHAMNLSVEHEFDLFGHIDYYEQLRGGQSAYQDYMQVKQHVFELKQFIDSQGKNYCLTHIDAVPDNFIITGDKIHLIDWEYAAMQDPHVDIAMFAIYSLYDKEHTDALIDIYFDNECDRLTKAKIYAYVAICGLLWSNWCEYKRGLGVEFGEYSLRQYRYAKDYYKFAKELIDLSSIKGELK